MEKVITTVYLWPGFGYTLSEFKLPNAVDNDDIEGALCLAVLTAINENRMGELVWISELDAEPDMDEDERYIYLDMSCYRSDNKDDREGRIGNGYLLIENARFE